MEQNIAAWMIAGGPRIEIPSIERNRANLRAFRERQREDHIGLIDRLRGIVRPATTEVDLVCCVA
ncbi:MAG TPA: hypothetical protein VNM34_12105 [Verrucomicrobiae bacterium]|nr:hypothetical protein [Verrucomicrobiae bacterium]